MSKQIQMSYKQYWSHKKQFSCPSNFVLQEYNAFFNTFGADKRKYTILKIYCEINVNICTLFFVMFRITIKFSTMQCPISSTAFYIECFELLQNMMSISCKSLLSFPCLMMCHQQTTTKYKIYK